MSEKTLNDWHNTDSIQWEKYWALIETLDKTIKKNQNPKSKSRSGWRWPKTDCNAVSIFRERFHSDGQVNKPYREIANEICPSISNGEAFVSGIIRSMIRMMNHSLKRRKWDLNCISKAEHGTAPDSQGYGIFDS